MRATFLTLFPELIEAATSASILGRAREQGTIAASALQLRAFSHRKDKAAHHSVDDTPCGGGPGMIVRADVAADAIRAAKEADEAAHPGAKRRVILVEPRGAVFTQTDARRLAAFEHLVFFCGRYEGTDARVEAYVDEVLSLGDFVLTGGELAALTMFDAIARLVPGVLGNAESAVSESHSEPLLEHRQYTKPIEHDGARVPAVLMSGNHKLIAQARRKDSLVLTHQLRPDLFERHARTREDDKLLKDDRVPTLAPERGGGESA
jgi:tRNA (guanine37-N1)-methyltransferase